MVKLRLAAAVALLTAALLGAFGPTAQANSPSCWEEYVACYASGTHPGDCNCIYQMCIGGWCD
jgi:hypothetical protein